MLLWISFLFICITSSLCLCVFLYSHVIVEREGFPRGSSRFAAAICPKLQSSWVARPHFSPGAHPRCFQNAAGVALASLDPALRGALSPVGQNPLGKQGRKGSGPSSPTVTSPLALGLGLRHHRSGSSGGEWKTVEYGNWGSLGWDDGVHAAPLPGTHPLL